jgi:NAD(P)-dependent dehydrogenase (short-subunit alcohol dehydrogenase family)
VTDDDNPEPRHVVVTGGNRGIGYAIVQALISCGNHVTFTARNCDGGAAALSRLKHQNPGGQIRLEICDVTSAESIRAFAHNVLALDRPTDALVNNARVLRPPAERQVTPGGIEVTLATNTLGPMMITTALAPALGASRSSRVLILTSRLHQPGSRGTSVGFDFDDPNLERDYHPDRAYKNSKLAAIWLSRELDQRLPASVSCNAICPGFVPSTAASYATSWERLLLRYVLPRFSFTRTVDEAAADVVWALDSDELAGVGGQYILDRTIASPSPEAADAVLAKRFWALAEGLVERM